MDFDELQPCDLSVHGLDERALAHAPRAPKQRIVGGKAAGEALRVGEQRVARAVDSLEQRKRQAVDLLDRLKVLRLGLPDEGVCGLEVGHFGLARAKALDRPDNPLDKAGERFLKVHVAPVAKAIGAAIVAPPSRDKCPSRDDKRASPVEGGHP